MNTALVIYDTTGKIITVEYGEVERPSGVPSVFVDVPDGAIIDHVDVATGEVIFKAQPTTPLGQLTAAVAKLQNQMSAGDGRLDDIEDAIVIITEMIVSEEA